MCKAYSLAVARNPAPSPLSAPIVLQVPNLLNTLPKNHTKSITSLIPLRMTRKRRIPIRPRTKPALLTRSRRARLLRPTFHTRHRTPTPDIRQHKRLPVFQHLLRALNAHLPIGAVVLRLLRAHEARLAHARAAGAHASVGTRLGRRAGLGCGPGDGGGWIRDAGHDGRIHLRLVLLRVQPRIARQNMSPPLSNAVPPAIRLRATRRAGKTNTALTSAAIRQAATATRRPFRSRGLRARRPVVVRVVCLAGLEES
ncbi:hypothetical protein EJ06DRAFT_262579 [Trichodelitschia bisporula]|uniref:Uncharacterized protein n=1 Tax=Trichodelitschia bisporula TaxID=703511 RepID=A0A6G1HI73_9PEZI|nr:hypothetical protein EJ06DRAFT_262579 [Trichodelitschia bisporula]